MNRLTPSAWVGGAMLLAFIFLGVFGPLLAPYSPHLIDLDHRFLAPSPRHWLGTDANGIDALSQLMWGARSALMISGIVVVWSAIIGVTVGVVAGYLRGAVDEALMRLIDILMAFPGILLNIAIVATVRSPGIGILIVALLANGWVSYARVARGEVLSLREREYVTAARAVGASRTRVMFRHILPNLIGPALVQMSSGLGTVILVEASLSFLGIGPQVDYTWGAMLSQGKEYLWRDGFGYYAVVAGLAIMWVVLGANLLGDGLRDRLDPRHRRQG